MGIEIRQAVPNDAPAACALLRRSIEDGCAADHACRPDILQAWLANKTPQNVLGWLSSPSNYAVVAERVAEHAAEHVDGPGDAQGGTRTLAGLALLNQAGKLALCYVQPDLLRSGVGSALLAAVEAQARAWNIGKLHMHSPASASAFFVRHGYVNAGKDKACFGLDADFLWKQMDASCAPAGKRFCKCGD